MELHGFETVIFRLKQEVLPKIFKVNIQNSNSAWQELLKKLHNFCQTLIPLLLPDLHAISYVKSIILLHGSHNTHMLTIKYARHTVSVICTAGSRFLFLRLTLHGIILCLHGQHLRVC